MMKSNSETFYNMAWVNMANLKSPSLASCLKTSDAIGLIANLLMTVLKMKNPKISNGLSYPTLVYCRTDLK